MENNVRLLYYTSTNKNLGNYGNSYKKKNENNYYKSKQQEYFNKNYDNKRGKSINNNYNKLNNKLLNNTDKQARNTIIQNLLESKIGLINAGGSCYMASIIQILIHSRLFLEQFYNNKKNNNNYLSEQFLNFIQNIARSVDSNNSIQIKDFANKYNKLNNKFRGDKGNNPMTFFTDFIKKLSEETNENILKLFMGKRYIKFEGMSDLNYEENFIFFLAVLNENKNILCESIFEQKEFEDNKNLKLIEEIIVKPEILIINLEFDDYIQYSIENWINVYNINYELKSINRYNDFHSTA